MMWTLAALLVVVPPQPPARREVVRGRVTADSGRPVRGAAVTATRAPDRAFRADTTDADGRYAIDWPDGTGDYLVHVAAPGFPTVRRRVTRAVGAAATDSVLVADVALERPRPQALDAVVTRARRPRPERAPAFGPDVGAAEQHAGELRGAVAPDAAGDLAAMAATIAGVTPVAGGVSVLGLGPAQNQTTLNGMAFAGADVPRDASTRVRLSMTSYDPARGWFGGATTNVELAPGNTFSSRRSHLTLDAPALQYTDAVSAALGQRFLTTQASVGGDGELAYERWYYNFGLQASRRRADVASLLAADAPLLRHAGVAADSAARLGTLLAAARVPTAAPGAGPVALRDALSFIGRLDHAPYDPRTLGPARSTWGLVGYARLGTADALGAGLASTAGHGGESTQATGALLAEYGRYFGREYLGTVRSGVTLARETTRPYLALPEGRVRVESSFPDAAGGVASLAFGGGGVPRGDRRRLTWETQGEVELYPPTASTHRVKLAADARFDGYALDPGGDPSGGTAYGSYAYNSLADLAANRPASFRRTLASPRRTGGEWNAFVALGDLWRVGPTFQLMYGARLEGNRFTAAPAHNPEIERLFGARTDHAPDGFHVSPRLGFTWNRTGQVRNQMMDNPLGRFYGTGTGILRGGVGEFRSLVPPALLADARVATGLPGGARRLACIGAATPTPDWDAYAADPAAIPTACAGGAPSLADAAPDVQLVAPGWAAPRSWRGNLTWTSSWRRLVYTLEGVWSLNRSQPAALDLNFADAPRFATADEGRPVFADLAGIVPATGLVSPVSARLAPAFGRVLALRGDARSTSRQATLTVTPRLGAGVFRDVAFSAGYTLASITTTRRGFDASTFESPTAARRERGDLDARHQFLFQGGWARRGVAVSLLGRLQSGTPFTPLVGGDVNGDGLANDRAFVHDDLPALLADAPGRARRCLERQRGRAAAPNGCEGPWTATMNARVGLAGSALGLGRRVDVGLNLANPLGGLDRLLHGEGGLRGWGAPATPDPVLYAVRGFDPRARRFLYGVNPRFGSTQPSLGTVRAPFRLTLDVRLDLARDPESQQVTRWLGAGRAGRRGPRLGPDELRRRFAQNVPDVYSMILRQSDSLLLARPQIEALLDAQRRYRARMDSLWTGLATELAALPDRFDAARASRRTNDSIDAAWEIARTELRARLGAILDPAQLQMLPDLPRLLFTSSEPTRIRINIAGG